MKSKNMALCALFAALLALCAWLCIPVGDTVFTLQTFGVASALLLLNGKRGSISVFVYLLLGTVGLPVFTGFRGGPGMLLGATGGYIMGFLVWALLYWLVTVIAPKQRLLAMVLGLAACYAFGSFWFYRFYLTEGTAMGISLVLLKCVVPYLLPDAVKLGLAFLLAGRLKRFV